MMGGEMFQKDEEGFSISMIERGLITQKKFGVIRTVFWLPFIVSEA
jgi:hypothetical protein